MPYYQDTGYKIDFLEEFLKLSPKRQDYYQRNFTSKNRQKISDFAIYFCIHGHHAETRHLDIINSAFYVLHRVHSGVLQQIIRERFQGESNLPVYQDMQHEMIIPTGLKKYYREIKFEYSSLYYCNDALFIPIFLFFWGLADQIYANYDFLSRKVKKLSQKVQLQTSTKILITEIVEKILIGNFINPDEIMLIKSDFVGFKQLVKLRQFLQLEDASMHCPINR